MVRSRRGFYFWKITYPGILGRVHFQEISLLLIFGPFWVSELILWVSELILWLSKTVLVDVFGAVGAGGVTLY